MSNQTSAMDTIENMAIVMAEFVQSGTVSIPDAKRAVRLTCQRTYKRDDNALKAFDAAWARFNGRIRKPA